MKASFIRIIAVVAVVAALAPLARAADITHKFLGIDNRANNLIYVDQTDPTNNWTTAIPRRSRDMQIVDGQKVLVSHGNGAGEYDLDTGKKLWAIDTFKGVNSARRLADGNTLLAGHGKGGIFITTVDRKGKTLDTLILEGIGDMRLIRRLKSGNILLTVGNTPRVIEVNPKGKIVWQAPLPGKGYKAVRTPCGNTLVSTAGAGVVLELDPAGKTVCSVGGKKIHTDLLLDCFSGFDTLKNGNIVVANWMGHGNIGKGGKHLIEFNRKNKVVWTWGDNKIAKVLTNVLLLDDTKPSATAAIAWTPLFDGKTLNGWTNPYKWGKAAAVDGEIHLTTTRSKFFLTTAKQYADFIFEVEVKMPAGRSNSGFMFRCHRKPNRVFGYQAEVDPSDRKWSGGLYDEGRRGWLHPNRKKKETIEAFRKNADGSFKRDGWNKYRIECVGDSLKISVNGVQTTDFKDSVDAQGYLALQHHGEKGKIYRFRNIRIKVIKPAKE